MSFPLWIGKEEKNSMGEEFMKKKFMKWTALAMTFVLFAGCTSKQYQEDKSFETDISGIYSLESYDEEYGLILQRDYKVEKDNTFEYQGMFMDLECYQSGTLQTEVISNEITKVIFDIANIEIKPNEDSIYLNDAKMPENIYKYKNMLGQITKVDDFPTSKTFDYVLPDGSGGGMVYTKKGHYHLCKNIQDCNDDYAGADYVRENNIIYFHIEGADSDSYWQIANYVVDDYLFTPDVYKEKE